MHALGEAILGYGYESLVKRKQDPEVNKECHRKVDGLEYLSTCSSQAIRRDSLLDQIRLTDTYL
jgi:hypothetical protein